ncbi:MAG: hypothetical protein KJ077_39325 [Anaerolineae bacterium]|nr:hypothetical protein [Anaerolineae bacterium]
MRELVVAEFITLDGVIQAPGGADEDTDGRFVHGGWTHPYWHDDIGMHFFQVMSQADALLLMIDIHASDKVITIWLAGPRAAADPT